MANRPNIKHIANIVAIAIAYLLLSAFLIGYKMEQLVLVCLFMGCYFISNITRKFILGFSVFIIFWIVFDYMKAFPNYHYSHVHLEQLYNAEKSLFGFEHNGIRITPNEYWLQQHTKFLDVLSGICYLSWVPVPLVFAGVLFFRDKKQFFYFSLTFLLVNLIGFTIYYIYPAAPPWYVEQYGFAFHAGTPGNTAGLARFDSHFNVSIFKGLYEKSSNVFAAMPSLHSSYPLIVLFYGIQVKAGKWNLLFALLTCGIWFSAVYTSHHYVLDVLAGICCAIVGIMVFRLLATRSRALKKWLDRAVAAVS